MVFQSDRGGAIRNIWSLGMQNRDLAQLTTFNDGGASHPALAPDGKTICFTRTSATGDLSIWLVNLDGTNLREISAGLDCTWTPNGHVVFAKSTGGNTPLRFDIWMSDADGRTARVISAPQHTWMRSPAISPDGRWLAYTVYPSLFSSDIREVPGGFEIDPDLRASIWLISLGDQRPPREVVPPTSFNSYSSWSRDGRQLYFTSNRSGSADIYSVDVFP
jgi:TolB protein